MAWRLDAIEIEGFRGFGEAQRLEFGGEDVLLLGENHQGKTSVLWALEWCLFETLEGVPVPRKPVRGTDPVLNRFADRARVKLELISEGGQAVFVRELQRGATARFTCEANGRTGEGEAADAVRDELLGLSIANFQRLALLHQDTIRGLLTDDARLKSEAIERLLGLEEIPGLEEALDDSALKKLESELAAEIDRVRTALKAEQERIEGELEERRREAREDGLEPDDIKISKLRSRVREIRQNFRAIAKEGAVRFQDPGAPGDLEEFPAYVDRFGEAIRNIVASADPTIRRRQAFEAREEARATLELLENRTKAYEEAEAALRQFDRSTELPDSVDEEQAKIEQEGKDLEIERRLTDSLARFLTAAQEHLGADEKGQKCPLCGQPAEAKQLSEDIARRLGEAGADELSALDERIAALGRRREELGAAVAARKELEETFLKAKQDRRESWEMTDRLIRDEDIEEADRLAALRVYVGRLDEAVAEAVHPVEGLESKLTEEEAKLKVIRDRMAPVLLAQKALQSFRARKREASAELRKVRARRRQAAQLRRRLRDIQKAVSKARRSLAERRFEEVVPDAKLYFQRIAGNPLYDSLHIGASEQRVSGVRRLRFNIDLASANEDGLRLDACTAASTGDLTAASLALFFGFTRSEAHPVGFVAVDDPTQTMDDRHCERLVEVLQEVRGRRQLILSTHDSRLWDALSSWSPPVRRYRFENWNRAGAQPRAE